MPGLALPLHRSHLHCLALGLIAALPAQAVEIRRAQVEPLTFADLDGWQDDDLAAAFATFQKSCGAILEGSKAMRKARPVYRRALQRLRSGTHRGRRRPARPRTGAQVLRG